MHIRLIICCVIRLAICGARTQSGFSNTSQRKQLAIYVMCTNTCSYACENSSFAHRQSHTNVRASGEARHEHECVNAVLDVGQNFFHFLRSYHSYERNIENVAISKIHIDILTWQHILIISIYQHH